MTAPVQTVFDCPICKDDNGTMKSSIVNVCSNRTCARLNPMHLSCVLRTQVIAVEAAGKGLCPLCRSAPLHLVFNKELTEELNPDCINVQVEEITQDKIFNHQLRVGANTTFFELLVHMPDLFERVVGEGGLAKNPCQDYEKGRRYIRGRPHETYNTTSCYQRRAFIQPTIARVVPDDTKEEVESLCAMNDQVSLGEKNVAVKIYHVEARQDRLFEQEEKHRRDAAMEERKKMMVSSLGFLQEASTREASTAGSSTPMVVDDIIEKAYEKERGAMLSMRLARKKRINEHTGNVKNLLNKKLRRTQTAFPDFDFRKSLIFQLNEVTAVNQSRLERNTGKLQRKGFQLEGFVMPTTNDITLKWVEDCNQKIEAENRNIYKRNTTVFKSEDREEYLKLIAIPDEEQDPVVGLLRNRDYRLGFAAPLTE